VNLAREFIESVQSMPIVPAGFADKMRARNPDLFNSNETIFENLGGKLEIHDGRVEMDGLSLHSSDFDISGHGWFSFDRRVDMKTTFTLSRRLTQDIISELPAAQYLVDSNGRIAIPLNISGLATKPAVTVDTDALSRRFVGVENPQASHYCPHTARYRNSRYIAVGASRGAPDDQNIGPCSQRHRRILSLAERCFIHKNYDLTSIVRFLRIEVGWPGVPVEGPGIAEIGPGKPNKRRPFIYEACSEFEYDELSRIVPNVDDQPLRASRRLKVAGDVRRSNRRKLQIGYVVEQHLERRTRPVMNLASAKFQFSEWRSFAYQIDDLSVAFDNQSGLFARSPRYPRADLV